LYNLKYRSDPENWKNANYDRFLGKTIHEAPKVDDPHAIDMDKYNERIRFVVTDFKDEIETFNQLISSGEHALRFRDEMELMKTIKDEKIELDVLKEAKQ